MTNPRVWALCACVCLSASALIAFGPARTSAGGSPAPERRGNPSAVTPASSEARARALDAYGRLPLRFEANRGQAGRGVKFVSRGSGYTLLLTGGEAVLRLRGSEEKAGVGTLKIKLDGARAASRVEGVNELQGRSNYFLGGSRRSWRTGVPAYEKVRYASVYPGVDLIYYGNQGRLEYDFHVAPGADPRRIRLRFEGAESVRLDEQGELVIGTKFGDVRQLRPVAYQEDRGERVVVASRYAVGEDGKVCFEVGDYDRGKPLVIDPVLVYSTYLGGSGGEQGLAVAVDAAGSAYVAGQTTSLDFPGPSPIQNTNGGANDAFVLKLSPAGDSLVYATYLGGGGDDVASSVAVDAEGNAYVAGWTGSGGFPHTPGAWQESKDGQFDAFLTKLNPTGASLVYSTFIGGANSEQAFGLDVDSSGRAYVTGRSDSPTLRTLPPDLRGGDAVQKSTNGAAGWSPSDTGLTPSTVNAFTFGPSNVIYAGTSNGVYRSTDAGNNWQLTGAARPSTAPFFTNAVALDPSNAAVIYAAASTGVFKSTDGGVLYEQKNNGLFIPSVNAIVVDPSAPSTLYAGTIVGLFKSTNGGESWAESRLVPTSLQPRVTRLVIDPSNPSVVYAGTTGGIFKTTNGGATWAVINNGLGAQSSTQIQALAIDPLNPSTLYLSTNFTSAVFKTTDGGANWFFANSGISVTVGGQTFTPVVNALAVDPSSPSTLYAGVSIAGVFKSVDGGASWTLTSGGMTSRNVLALAVAPDNPATVYAGAAAGGDAFVARFNAAGSHPEYVRFIGGSENEDGRGIAADAAGNAYVVGSTTSENFPVNNAVQPTTGGFSDGFVLKLDSTGASTLYSTYLGGNSTDVGRAVKVNAAGSAFVTGTTASSDFPVNNAVQPTMAGFTDAFVTKFAPSGASFVYSTYLGGSFTDQGLAIAVDSADNVVVAGNTAAADFPLVNPTQSFFGGTFDAFVSKLNAAGSSLVFSTFLGGSGNDQGNAVALDAAGGIYVVGNTPSSNFPVANPLKTNLGGASDAFITKLGPAFELSLVMNDSPDPVPLGSDLTYTLVVTNNGELPARGVTLTDTLPAGALFISATPGQGACAGGAVVTCNLGTLNAGASTSVVIVIRPPAVREITNTAVVAADAPDPVPTNNTASVTTQVNFADLSVTAAPAFNKVAPGGHINYLLRVTNRSGGTAESVTVTHGLPAGTSLFSCSTNGNCVASGNTVAVTFASLAAGKSDSVVLVASVDAGLAEGTTLNSTTTVSAATPDPDAGNNAADAAVTVTATPLRRKENGRVAFSSDRLFTVKPDGSEAPVLVPGLPNISIFPRWSPDGSRLAYITQRSNPNFPFNQIHRLEAVNADGTGLTVLADNPADITFFSRSGFAWSPDGTRLAYVGTDRFIHIASADGSGHAKLPGTPAQVRDVDWSPDGSRFVFSKDAGEIHLMNVDGSGLTKLVALGSNSDGPTHYTSPVWSPDGTKILYLQRSNNNTDIFLMNSDGTGQQRFINRPQTSAPSWSPDGTKVVFYHSTEVRVVDFAGTNDAAIATNQSCCGAGGTSWQPIPTNDPLPPPGPPAPTFKLSGNVTFNNGGFGPASLRLEGPISITVGLGPGPYQFTRLPPGQYTLTPSSVAFTFNPPSRTVTVTDADITGLDFAATFVPAHITGRVTDTNGAPLAGIRMTSVGGFPEGTTFTDANGFYSFPNVQRFRNYSISPDPFTPYTFSPSSRFIQNLTTSTEANFVGTRQPTHVIRGRVVEAATGNGIPSIQVNLGRDGNAATFTFTDSNGNFTFGDRQANHQYSVSISFHNTFIFDPKFDAPTPFAQIIIPSLTADADLTFFGVRHNTVQFTAAAQTVNEGSGQAVINVTRTGDVSQPATVNYETSDGTASEKSDYTAGFGTLRFAANETTKTLTVFITDDVHVEGTQTFSLRLDRTFGTRLGGTSFMNVSITDNDTAPSGANPSDDSAFFVRQHYRDFLGRDPDPDGLAFWVGGIESCGADARCREAKRVDTSAAFFLSIEFQETGYLAYRAYKAAYGDATSPNVPGTVPVIRLREFLTDAARIGNGVQVGVGDWQQRLEANKNGFASEFVSRTRFRADYPAGMTAEEFVSKLDARAGGVLSAEERAQLVALLGQTPADELKRSQVLRRVAEDADLRRRETNRAFVLMQYYGYMRRNPDDPQDTNFGGWRFWLDKLEQFGGNFVEAEMVKAFITSIEYRQRFGQ